MDDTKSEQKSPAQLTKRIIFLLSVGLVILMFLAVGALLIFRKPQTYQACTMEAKICPDGTTVSRSGPKCEFKPCPDGSTGNTGTAVPLEP